MKYSRILVHCEQRPRVSLSEIQARVKSEELGGVMWIKDLITMWNCLPSYLNALDKIIQGALFSPLKEITPPQTFNKHVCSSKSVG